MAKQTLPTNYQDDVMSSSAEGMRKYLMIYNTDNTVSFKDVTPYDLEGTDFGAGDINRTNEAVNQSLDKSKVIDDITAITAITQTGYASGALALKNVNSRLGGNAITYDESEDAYYIQHGADTASKKKLGRPTIYNLGKCTSPATFNIASIVGSNHIADYTSANFLVVTNPNVGASATNTTPNNAGAHDATATVSITSVSINYDSSNGNVSVSGGNLSLSVTAQGATPGYANKTLEKTVYFLDDAEIATV